MVYLLKMVIFHGYVSHNQMVYIYRINQISGWNDLPAVAAPITGENTKEVAGCNSDEARDVAMVAAEKRPRPGAIGGKSWMVFLETPLIWGWTFHHILSYI